MGTNRFSPPDPIPPHECANPNGKVWCAVCFRKLPHVGDLTVGLQFSYGKDQFHGPTLRERQDKQVAEAKAAGLDPQPVGTRWV